MATVKQNLSEIESEIAPYTPNIIAVTKYFDESRIIEAYNAGLRDFGESRIPECIEKIKRLPENIRRNSRFHLIGHLQSNKANKAVGFFDYIHSVDSLKLAEIISEIAIKKGLVQKILLQLNNAGEEQKFGFSKETLLSEFAEIIKFKGIKITGLMNIAPFGLPSEELTKLFKEICDIKTKLKKNYDCDDMTELSMGMSCDYKEASAAGATMLRIGRKLFS